MATPWRPEESIQECCKPSWAIAQSRTRLFNYTAVADKRIRNIWEMSSDFWSAETKVIKLQARLFLAR
jgi:hypothetical protein